MERKMRTLKISLLVFILSITMSAQDFWEQTSGPSGGLIYGTATNSNGWIYVGTAFSGIHLSTDAGQNWEPKNNGLTDPIIFSIFISSNDYIFAGSYQHGLFRSTDSGENWSQIQNGIPGDVVVKALT
jgi:photosystem II stability/assembly factor-like uncharacterized protein